MSTATVHERAYAKLNLVLHVGPPRPDGLHPLCSIFASIDLADDVHAEPAQADTVECPSVAGPNLAEAALRAFRDRIPSLPPLSVRIEKRIPVAAGLGGGSADAAAVLRAANRVAGEPLDGAALRDLGAQLGSDVPSQVEPAHALVQGVGELVEPLELPPLAAVLVPRREGLSTAEVYAELDRIGGGREELDAGRLRAVAGAGPTALVAALENDLQPAALSLRPELAEVLDSLRAAGAQGALVSGSGPTCFGLFDGRAAAERAAAAIDGALVAGLRAG
ncbi:MAG: 4-diphosphocytidyl-2-C-methyl-D-erythritol kinase [Thermoleophilaceae bacterium]|jgi:4-diphosphocytidyl-2-C-methyl-D-erythritol kinase|nr:4-diphosphocytidyl-2-C-methyl-D-erythritol kinase [Thermoleophilaceae bacterium]